MFLQFHLIVRQVISSMALLQLVLLHSQIFVLHTLHVDYPFSLLPPCLVFVPYLSRIQIWDEHEAWRKKVGGSGKEDWKIGLFFGELFLRTFLFCRKLFLSLHFQKIENMLLLTLYFLFRSLRRKDADPSRRYALKMIPLLHRFKRNKKRPLAVVSVTSHDFRVEEMYGTIYSILNGSCQRVKIVLTLYKDDLPLLKGDMKRLVKAGVVELIVADKDLGPHLKYFYAMQRYRELPVITIDDDVLYPRGMVQSLLDDYSQYPDTVIGRRCYELRETGGQLVPYSELLCTLSQLTAPSHRNFATGIGGVLYPPDAFKLCEDNIREILEMKYDDDFYLKALEVRMGIRVLAEEHSRSRLFVCNKMDGHTQSIGLWETRNKAKSDENMKFYEKEFLSAARDCGGC